MNSKKAKDLQGETNRFSRRFFFSIADLARGIRRSTDLELLKAGVCLCFFAFLLTTDQPARSSYQPMTIIAYLHDCHCRYDERSNVQKKTVS